MRYSTEIETTDHHHYHRNHQHNYRHYHYHPHHNHHRHLALCDHFTARNLCRVEGLGDGVESYSGYLTVDEKYDSNLFFWFFPVQVIVKLASMHASKPTNKQASKQASKQPSNQSSNRPTISPTNQQTSQPTTSRQSTAHLLNQPDESACQPVARVSNPPKSEPTI